MEPKFKYLDDHCEQIGGMAALNVPRGTSAAARRYLKIAVGNLALARVHLLHDRASSAAMKSIDAGLDLAATVVAGIYSKD